MAIAVKCTCGKRFKAKDEQAGKTFRCSQCGASIAVPWPEQPDEMLPATAPAPLRIPQATVPTEAINQLQDFLVADSAPAKRKSTSFRSLPAAVLFVLLISVSGVGLYIFMGTHEPGSEKPPEKPAAAGELERIDPVAAVVVPQNAPDNEPNQLPEAQVVQAALPEPLPEPPKAVPKQPQPETEQKEQEEPYDLKGDKLGMSLQDFKKKYFHKNQSDPRDSPFCSDQRDVAARENDPIATLSEEPWHPKAKIVNARITFPFEDFDDNKYTPALAGVKTDGHLFRFVDSRLYRIEFFFPNSGFADVQEAMVAKYGEPKDVSTHEYQNSFGAKFTGLICMWHNGVSGIILKERSVDLKTGLLMFTHLELDKVAESRRAKFRKSEL